MNNSVPTNQPLSNPQTQTSELLQPFGVLLAMAADREKYNYGKRKYGRPENKLEALVGLSLEEQGISVQYQVKCDAGIADIVTPDAIYEVKPDICYAHKMFEAIGQVVVYRQMINPSARAYVVGYPIRGGRTQKQLDAIQNAAKAVGVEVLFWDKPE